MSTERIGCNDDVKASHKWEAVSIYEKLSKKQAKEKRLNAYFLAKICQRELVQAFYEKFKGLDRS